MTGVVLTGDSVESDVRMAKLRTLREARLDRSEPLSANELAERAGTYASTILDIEEGRTTPRMGTIRKIAQALGIDPREVAWPGDPFGVASK